MSSHKVRPPLAKIQSTLEHSKAKGAELAKQAATARLGSCTLSQMIAGLPRGSLDQRAAQGMPLALCTHTT